MGLRDTLREFGRGIRDILEVEGEVDSSPVSVEIVALSDSERARRAVDEQIERTLRAAEKIEQQAQAMPEGSDARGGLIRLAEEIRVVAAGMKAKALLENDLDNPAIRQLLSNAGIKID